MKVYFFADQICIHLTTLGCREEKNEEKNKKKGPTTQEMPTCSSNPQKPHRRVFFLFTTSESAPVENLCEKSRNGGYQSEDIQVSTQPTSFRHHDLLRASAPNQSCFLMRKCREKPAVMVCGSQRTCPPKGWM